MSNQGVTAHSIGLAEPCRFRKMKVRPNHATIRKMQKIELIREAKLFCLIPRRTRKSRLEASGVALIDDSTAFVEFDNLNQIARIDVSLKRSRRNGIWHTPSL